jgi:UDP-N-acetylglucosamine:LPS N-acetylglucosamine transferase
VKIIVGSSSGGHTTELLTLLNLMGNLLAVTPTAVVTTMRISESAFLHLDRPIHYVGEADRSKPLRSIAVLLKTMGLALRERPDIVITTGSMPLALFCFWCRIFGAKIIWIDSIAQMESMSLSGQFVKLFSSLCFVQWPELAKRYKNVIYAGEVL